MFIPPVISYFSVYDYNLAMVSVQGMIDIGEFERVELDNFDSFVTDCLYVFLFNGLLFDKLPKASNKALTSTPSFTFSPQ